METVNVTVTNAFTGAELLHEKTFPCIDLVDALRSELGHRRGFEMLTFSYLCPSVVHR